MLTAPHVECFPVLPRPSCFSQKGAQISFPLLPLHRPEEKSGRADRGGILPAAEREAQDHPCTFFAGTSCLC